ncbi:transferase, partial [Streptomyces sp. SID5926]|nr:transferase [Streptomyces sp. SID5926]
TPHEITTMLITSVLIPPAATWHRLSGLWRHRDAPAWREVAA